MNTYRRASITTAYKTSISDPFAALGSPSVESPNSVGTVWANRGRPYSPQSSVPSTTGWAKAVPAIAASPIPARTLAILMATLP